MRLSAVSRVVYPGSVYSVCSLCAAVLCCGMMKVKFSYTARTVAEAMCIVCGSVAQAEAEAEKPMVVAVAVAMTRLQNALRHTHTHSKHAHSHMLLAAAGNAVTHTATHNALDYGAYA